MNNKDILMKDKGRSEEFICSYCGEQESRIQGKLSDICNWCLTH